jgi:DNA repair photolyase
MVVTEQMLGSERPQIGRDEVVSQFFQPVMLNRLAALDVIGVDAAVTTGKAGDRAMRLLENRRRVAPDRLPNVLIMAHTAEEYQQALAAAERFRPLAQAIEIQTQRGRNETAIHTLQAHRTGWPECREQERKSHVLLLSRRGGGGKPQFIVPFVGGAGTTCGTWTPIIAYKRGKTTWIAGTRSREEEQQAEPIRGFLRGNYAQGVCPAECSFCYLRGLQGMGIKEVCLNLEDAIPELNALPRGSVVNWAELGGPVEEDPWFVDEHGQGSLIQTILDLSTERGIVAFFLTKGVYEPYLQLEGRLALLAISLNAPAISPVFEPGGATAEERLRGLAWAIDHGAMDHTIRLGPIIPIEGYKQYYRELFALIADILGPRLKRITVDILRFSPQMPGILRASFPEAIVSSLLAEMESEVKAHKYRPSVHRQQRFYHWIRALLAHYGMDQVRTTPCKADPAEAARFLRAGDISSMPCACHVSYQDRARIQHRELPIVHSQTVKVR